MILEVVELSKLYPNNKGASKDSIRIESVMTDSRKEAKQSLFVPIVGESFDAHRFIGDAIKHGAVAAVWQKDVEVPALVPTDFPLFFVDDTTKALQDVADYYLKKVDPVIVGVTGSNGKTTTKDLVAAVLSTRFRTHKTAGNFNNHIGLPLTILSMDLRRKHAYWRWEWTGQGRFPFYPILQNRITPSLRTSGSLTLKTLDREKPSQKRSWKSRRDFPGQDR
ncbi:UDP-N-acetylmuramoyl-tripeptide--D-alanyl-D-alanine ligase [Halobacillus sp. BAB-2008]|nr:UDP-N-acetylmuramoyl-tripeptide--D-alanyl-D-alanine ligase [Halobacillus sp. BAB-2008]